MNAKALPAMEERDDSRSIEDLEDEITALSATIQAATYRLLVLVEEMDRRGGWANPLGSSHRSCAHWLSHRAGYDLGTARQYVRVARALPGLPLLAEAFSRGELSYSKVRALTRIADAQNEATLLDWARSGTASHIETLVRKYRRADRLLENEKAEEREASRGLTTWYDTDGMLVVEGRLTPEQGAVLLKALDRAKDELYARTDGSAESRRAQEGRAEDESAGAHRLADALGLLAERALAAGAAEGGGGDRFLDRQGREVLAAPPMPSVTGDPAKTLAARWVPPGVEISPSTGVPTWEGEPFDYGWAIEDLQAKAGIA